MFQILQRKLPYEGNIPGARGHKKIVIPKGTTVYVITYGHKVYWCAYLDEADARKTMAGLEATVRGECKRTIDLDNLVAWNFKYDMPKRIHRPGVPKQSA